jgi:hypothetical protein
MREQQKWLALAMIGYAVALGGAVEGVVYAVRRHRQGVRRAVLVAAGLEPDSVEVADLDGPTLLVAARVGATRLIDNVPLRKGESR